MREVCAQLGQVGAVRGGGGELVQHEPRRCSPRGLAAAGVREQLGDRRVRQGLELVAGLPLLLLAARLAALPTQLAEVEPAAVEHAETLFDRNLAASGACFRHGRARTLLGAFRVAGHRSKSWAHSRISEGAVLAHRWRTLFHLQGF